LEVFKITHTTLELMEAYLNFVGPNSN